MSEEVPGASQESASDGAEVAQEAALDPENVSEDIGTTNADFKISVKDQSEVSSDSGVELVEENPPSEKIKSSGDNEARLEQLEKEHETLRSQYMRIAADFDNFRKRQTRDHDDLRIQLLCNTLSEILPVVDNFERARQQLDPQGEEAQALHRSYQGLYKQLVDVLKQLGVAPMRVVDQVFDPNLHEAVLREPSEEKAEDIVLEELQRGYHLDGRVLRHALVKVSMGPGPQSQESLQKEDTSKEDSVPNQEDDTSKKEI